MLIKSNRDDHRVAWFTALAIAIHVLESALPSPIPGVKPGLANVVTVVVLIRYGVSVALWVSLLRVLAGSLILGTFLTPTFILSLSGAVASVILLILASRQRILGLSALGYCVLAAMAHMAAQFGMVYLLFVPHEALFHLLPVLMSAALIFGVISGIIALTVMQRLSTP